MAECVVCGIDDSDGARKATVVADRLARDLGARLVLVHAAPITPSVMYGVPFDNESFQREVLENAERLLEEVARACRTAALSRRTEQGAPAETLKRVVDEERADLLVVGTRGRGAMRSVLLGSVAHEMLAISACPVVVVSPHVVG